ncbi:MAG: ADP-ribosylglycohydrolase family protein [Akkermansiaceae bacterium]
MTTPSDIVLGSFIGDALALGPHWIYQQKELRQRFGHIMDYLPPATAYHAGKQAGDLTHLGDQSLLLLRSIAEFGAFDLNHYAAAWRAFWENPATISYRDGATKATLSHLKGGRAPESAASDSSDLAGAVHIAPLFLLKWKNDDLQIAAARSLTSFTHGDPAIVETADFLTRLILAVHRGSSIPNALEQTATLPHWNAFHADWIEAAKVSAASSATDSEALFDHGLTCHIPDAFTGVCHLLLRHPESPADALIANINAGGDSAARGMVLGMIYGARHPVASLPPGWLSGLRSREEILTLIRNLS